MRTHIIQLETHDDVISTCDKMGWSKSRRVLLIWPRLSGVLERKLDLVILLRHARQLGMQLAIVSRVPDVQQQARALGIPLFQTASEAQRRAWRRPRPPPGISPAIIAFRPEPAPLCSVIRCPPAA